MHEEAPEDHKVYAMPPAAPEPPTAGEWAIGIVFVLAALGVVAMIGWALAGLPA